MVNNFVIFIICFGLYCVFFIDLMVFNIMLIIVLKQELFFYVESWGLVGSINMFIFEFNKFDFRNNVRLNQ